MAKLIKANGEVTEISPNNGTDFSLEELQGYVGGYIQNIYMGDEIMVVNEEGKLRGLQVNIKATFLVNDYLKDCIVGDVVVCKNSEQL